MCPSQLQFFSKRTPDCSRQAASGLELRTRFTVLGALREEREMQPLLLLDSVSVHR